MKSCYQFLWFQLHDYDCIKEINEQEIVEGKSENPFAILKKIKIADGGKE